MSSRRLDISSLLCDEPPDDHVVLAPHLRNSNTHTPASSSSTSRPPVQVPATRSRANTVHYDHSPQQQSPRPSSSNQHSQGFLGLEALVHAATQERRRLSGGELVQPQPQQPQPRQPQVFSPHQHHLQPSQFQRSPWQEDHPYPPRPPQSPLHPKSIDELTIHSPRETYKTPTSPYHQPRHHPYEDDQRLHQMRQYQLQEREREQRVLRAQELERHQRIQMQQEADRIRAQEAERLSEIERKANLERQKMEEERLKLEAERMRLLEVERRLQEQEQRRHDEQRREAERVRLEEERRESERREREIAAIREAERREQQRRDREIELHRRQEEQRYYGVQELQRNDEMQRRLHQHHHQQQQRQYVLQQQQLQQQHHHHQQSQRVYEHPPRIEIPPGPQLTTARKSDPMPIIGASQSRSPVIQSNSPMADQRPTKKRRYSESPSLPPIQVDDSRDRIQRDREKMSVGEIGYGRHESAMTGPSLPSHATVSSPLSTSTQALAPRRPLSGSGPRKPVSVSDLLTPDPDGSTSTLSSPSMAMHSPRMVVIPSRETTTPTGHSSSIPSSYPPHHSSMNHRVLSPLGRRSPPGSQVGRAKAARKSDDHRVIAHSGSISSTPSSSVPSLPNQVIHVPEGHPRSPVSILQPQSPLATIASASPTGREDYQARQPPIVKRQTVDNDEIQLALKGLDVSTEPPRKRTPASSTKEKEPRDHSNHQHPLKTDKIERLKESKGKEEGDAHDWLLELYAETSSSRVDRESPLHLAISSTTSHPGRRTHSPSSATRTKSPVVSAPFKKHPTPPSSAGRDEDEDDGGLDQELEQLLAEVKVPSAKDALDAMDVDLDSAVAELVAETLEEKDESAKEGNHDSHRRQPVGREEEEEEEEEEQSKSLPPMTLNMADDVEDELLSLVEDKLPGPSSSAFNKSATSTSKAKKPQTKLGKRDKSVPPPLRTSGITSGTAGSISLPSTKPSTSPVSGSLAHSTSTRHHASGAEGESMPPPNSATTKEIGAKKKPKAKQNDKSKDSETNSPSSTPAQAEITANKKKGNKKPKAGPANSTAAPTLDESAALGGATSTIQKSRTKSSVKGKKPAAEKETSSMAAPSTPTLETSAKPGPPSTKSSIGITLTKGPSASRSRSTSVMPGGAANDPANPGESKATNEEDGSDDGNEDDKLYCVCKTKYDQERFMIACDRCDEWYHMQCVDMPELVADLVDQFFCPPCIEKNPELHLSTTYKARCLWGIKHPDPDSSAACHRPARGAFSKYCSEECGVKYMQSRIDAWAKKGGKKEKLWESVKFSEKREGVVVKVEMSSSYPTRPSASEDSDAKEPVRYTGGKPSALSHLKAAKPLKAQATREKERLLVLLDKVTQLQDEMKKGIEILTWRERLLSLAIDRSEMLSQCGWDQRLCFGDEDWAEELGQSIADSYEAQDNRMDIDGNVSNEEGQWWCGGDPVCARHVGWQSTRFKDISKEKEKREEALLKLDQREQDLRRQLEEMINPTLPNHKQRRLSSSKSSNIEPSRNMGSKGALKPFASSNARLSNGHGKAKVSLGEPQKKGKKRKAP